MSKYYIVAMSDVKIKKYTYIFEELEYIVPSKMLMMFHGYCTYENLSSGIIINFDLDDDDFDYLFYWKDTILK